MALLSEEVADDLIAYLRARFETQLDVVTAASDAKIPLPPPLAESYHLGPMDRFAGYRAPVVFVVPDRVDIPVPGSADDYAVIDKETHRFLVAILVEQTDEPRLTRACMRYARAARQSLDNAEITSVTHAQAGIKMTSDVRGIDYGMTFPRDGAQRPFRKAVSLLCEIKTWDARSMG